MHTTLESSGGGGRRPIIRINHHQVDAFFEAAIGGKARFY